MEINSSKSNAVHSLKPGPLSSQRQQAAAAEVQEAFRKFVGATFYGQMLKSMRSTVGKPAYFHGGQAEEAFRGQLDQQLAEQMTAATADKIADPMFARQFPRQAQILADAKSQAADGWDRLATLPRR